MMSCEVFAAGGFRYTAGMTRIDSGVFSKGWDTRLGITPADIMWCKTGERLSWENWDEKQAEGGTVIIHSIPPEVTAAAMAHPRVMIASDGIPWIDGTSHPRSAGCFCRVRRMIAVDTDWASLIQWA